MSTVKQRLAQRHGHASVAQLADLTEPSITLAGREIAASTANATGDAPTEAAVAQLQRDADKENRQTAAKASEKAKQGVIDALSVFVDQFGTVQACIPRATGRVDVAPVASELVGDFMTRKLVEGTGKPPGKAATEALVACLRAGARERGHIRHVHNRIAPAAGNSVLIDLANAAGEVVRVDAGGVAVIGQGDVLFQRGTGAGELPAPSPMTAHDAWAVLQTRFFDWGIPPADHAVVAVVLCECLRPDTPKPLVEILGSAGSAKTTTAKHLISVIDPMPKGAPPTFRPTDADVMAAASQRFALFLDNASRLTPDEQDLLCKVATGGAMSARRYYTQGETFVAETLAPVFITGITSVATRSDLRSRTITITLPARSGGYRSATEVAADFEKARQPLFSAVCTLLSAGLAGMEAVRTQRPYTHRLADFEQLGEAIHQALGQPPGWFGDVMAARRQNEARGVVDDDPSLAAVLEAVKKAAVSPAQIVPAARVWAGATGPGIVAWKDSTGAVCVLVTMKRLLSAVTSATFGDLAGPSDRAPRTEKALRNLLQHRQPTLRELGWTVELTQANDRSAARFRPC